MPDLEDLPLLTDEERIAFGGVTAEDLRAPHPFQVESDARRAARIEREAAQAAAPVAALRRLAAAPVGASQLFTQYKRSSQLSALIQIARDGTGASFSCKREYSLIDGSVAGIRVTRTA